MSLVPVERFDSSTGVRIYRLPVEAFPKFVAYSYLLLGAGVTTLVDCGSGMEKSNADLLAAFEEVRASFGEAVQLQDVQRILITHAHIDHHGGLNFVRGHVPNAEVGIHALDRRTLVAYEERVIVATKNLRIYLERAGVSAERISKLLEMYGFAKRLIRSERVDFGLEENQALDGMQFIHTPGHCPGQVCIRLGDVLLSADHVLNRITPHQAPESITHYTGLGHYLGSLDKIAMLDGLRLALGGHEAPIEDIYGRVAAIRNDHLQKLERVINVMARAAAPCTISDISKEMYADMHGYNVLLALEEVGAHVEYLYERGQLAIANLDEVERDDNPALRYSLI